jgi:hypothetical protein
MNTIMQRWLSGIWLDFFITKTWVRQEITVFRSQSVPYHAILGLLRNLFKTFIETVYFLITFFILKLLCTILIMWFGINISKISMTNFTFRIIFRCLMNSIVRLWQKVFPLSSTKLRSRIILIPLQFLAKMFYDSGSYQILPILHIKVEWYSKNYNFCF